MKAIKNKGEYFLKKNHIPMKTSNAYSNKGISQILTLFPLDDIYTDTETHKID